MKTTRISLIISLFLTIILANFPTAAVRAQPAKPRVYILATGGTIAGSAQSSAQASYTPGVLSIEQIIRTVPGISQLANLTGVQVCNISSQNMEEVIWLRLWKITDSLFSNNLCDGVVITHGTDTMEETAYFLNLTVRHSNPVVLTGAMRPSTSLSADGPFNLYNSVALAASPDAKGRGVMVVMNDFIYCANDVTKGHTLNTASFSSPNYGPLGRIRDGQPSFDRTNKFVHTASSCFDISNITKLPATEIVYSYAFASDAAINAIIDSGAKGIVIAGVGHGNYNRPIAEAIKRAAKKGVAVVRSTRIQSGGVDTAAEEFDPAQPVSLNKSPQKARILLMLALTKTGDPATIQEIFIKY